MIFLLGSKLAAMLAAHNTISPDDTELYSYGFFLILSKILYLTITVILGFTFRVLWESIAFYVLFSKLREYSGGIHARTEAKCFVCSISVLSVSVGTIHYMEAVACLTEAFVLLIAGCTAIFLLAPISSSNKQLTSTDWQRYRHISRCLTILYVALSIIATWTYRAMFYTVTTVIFMVGFLLTADAVSSRMHSMKSMVKK